MVELSYQRWPTVSPHWYKTLPGVLLVKLRFTLTGLSSLALRFMVSSFVD
jgi:hypothetical protein